MGNEKQDGSKQVHPMKAEPSCAEPEARPEPRPEADARIFVTTHWSVVLATRNAESPEAKAALQTLCRTYWYPLYAYVRRRGRSSADAQDLVQGFFAALITGNYLAQADRVRGRFRTFLLTAINNFLHNEHDRATALKRGGGKVFVSWEEHAAENRYALEPPDIRSPEIIFEKRWATTLLEQVLARLRQEFNAAGRAELFDALKPHLWTEDDAEPYAQLAEQFNLSVSALKVTTHRLRQRYRELLLAEIAQTVADPAEVEDEIRYLLHVLSG